MENVGQWPERVRFRSELGSTVVHAEADGIGLQVEGECCGRRVGHYVRLVFEGALPSQPVGEGVRDGKHTFFTGAGAEDWFISVSAYASVLYTDLYPGIDLRLREEGRHFEYDLLVRPGAKLEEVIVRCEGIDSVCIAPDGTLVLETAAGQIRQAPPRTWEVSPLGTVEHVACSYVPVDGERFGFHASRSDASRPLVIDPGLEWSTFLGFSSGDWLRDLARHPGGDVLVTGRTLSPDLPQTPGAYSGGSGSETGFVARLTADGTGLVYSAKIKGINCEALAVHPDGGPILAGRAVGTIPTTPGAFDTTPNSGVDGFVLRLTPAGDGLVYSTFLGGNGGETAEDLAVDALGQVTVVGSTCSTNFPTTPGAFDTSTVGDPLSCSNRNAFVARLTEDGSGLVFSTYLGGDEQPTHPPLGSDDEAHALALDTDGSPVVTGWTMATDFPVTPGAVQAEWNGRQVFVTRLAPDGADLEFSTLLGGSGDDRATAVSLGPCGTVHVVGFTRSPDFPVTPGAFDTIFNVTGSGNSSDGFLARLDPAGTSLLYSTFLGGGSDEVITSVAVDPSGVTTIAGSTASGSFPTTPGAFQTTPIGFFEADFFLARFSPSGRELLYSTLIGGNGDGPPDFDEVSLALDPSGSAVAGLSTGSDNFPITPGAFDPTPGAAGLDIVVLSMDMLPAGVSKYGSSTLSCLGSLALGVTSMPVAGGEGFAVTCSAAPPDALGLLVASAGAAAGGIPIGDVLAWIDPSQILAVLPATAGEHGYAVTPLRLPPGTRGFAIYVQYGFLNTSTCPGSGPFSSSNALAIVVQ